MASKKRTLAFVVSLASLIVALKEVRADSVQLIAQYGKIEPFVSSFRSPFQQEFFRTIGQSIDGNVLSQLCRRALEQFAKDLAAKSKFAHKMFDANGKFISGLLWKDFVDFGHYDQCAKTPSSRYSLLRLHWPLPSDTSHGIANGTLASMNGSWLEIFREFHEILYFETFTIGTCVPSSCSREELSKFAQSVSRAAGLPIKPEFETFSNFEEQKYSEQQIYKKISGSILVLLAITTLISTAFPLRSGLFSHFNAIKNTRKLFSAASIDQDSRRLSFLSGIKLLYFLTTAILHFLFNSGLTTSLSHVNFLHFIWNANFYLQQFAVMGTNFLCVNFLVGGVLSYYSWHGALAKSGGKLSPFLFVAARVLRTTPLIVASVLVVLAFPSNWGSGPLFHKAFANVTANCLTNYWAEFGYVSNQLDGVDICLPHGWYMGADFQLYLMSYFAIVALYKWPRFGFKLISVAIVCGAAGQFLMLYTSELPPILNYLTINYHKVAAELRPLHFLTINYVSSYSIGLALGVIITKNIEIKPKALLSSVGWLIVNLMAITCAYAPMLIKLLELKGTLAELIIGACFRTFMCFGVALFVYLIWLNPQGLLFKAFAWRPFIVLGRLSFSSFMMHYLFIWYENFNLRSPVQYFYLPMALRSIHTLVVSFSLGLAMYIVVEAPFFNVTKAAFVKRKAQN